MIVLLDGLKVRRWHIIAESVMLFNEATRVAPIYMYLLVKNKLEEREAELLCGYLCLEDRSTVLTPLDDIPNRVDVRIDLSTCTLEDVKQFFARASQTSDRPGRL